MDIMDIMVDLITMDITITIMDTIIMDIITITDVFTYLGDTGDVGKAADAADGLS